MAGERAAPERVSKATLALRIGLPAVRKIILKAGVPVVTSERRLLVALNRAYEAASTFEAAYAAPTQVQIFKHLARIRATSRKLSTLLGMAGGKDIRDTQRRLFYVLCHEAGDATAVLAAVKGVEHLHLWADRLTDKRPENAPEVNTQAMFALEMLPEIYERHFGREFGVTTNKRHGKTVYGGPAIRFATAVLDAIEAPMAAAALAKAWHRHLVAAGQRQQ